MAMIFPAAIVLLTGLLYFSRHTNIIGLLVTKPVLSLLFVITGYIQDPLNPVYAYAVLAGLILSLIGDVCLIFTSSKKMFLLGLVAFLSAHLAYLAAFSLYARFSIQSSVLMAFFMLSGFFAFQWLKPTLGSMLLPVIAYIVVITGMVAGAGAVFFNTGVTAQGRYLILSGAVLFYLSDLFVARNQFVKTAYINRLIGLPVYYTGQFLLALSIGHAG